MTTPRPTATSTCITDAMPRHAPIAEPPSRNSSDAAEALNWLTEVANHPDLSDDAKEVAAIMSGGWTSSGGRCRRGARWVLEHSRLPDYDALRAASNELREAGFITGHGGTASIWKMHPPAEQLPVVEARRREDLAKESALALEQKLRQIRNGGLGA